MSNEKRVRRTDLAWNADARPIRMEGWRRSTSAGANHGPRALGAAEREVEWAIFSSG
jgi:hypothetical protein